MSNESKPAQHSPSAPAVASSEKYPWRSLALLLLITALVRGGVLWLMPEGLSRDPDDYRAIAENLATRGLFARNEQRRTGIEHPWHSDVYYVPTATRAPLYSLMLSHHLRGSTIPPERIGMLHALLGIATVALTFQTARLWGLDRLAFFIGLLVACDPILLKQSAEIMTETMAAFFAALGTFTLTRFHRAGTPFNAGLGGGALALAALCRPVFFVWLALCLLAIPFCAANWMRRLNFTAYALVAATVIAPWAIRNCVQFNKPIVTTTLGGNTLFLSNNREFYAYLRSETRFMPWTLEWAADRHAGNDVLDTYETQRKLQWSTTFPAEELERREDQFFYECAFSRILENPGMFAYSCVYRQRRLWGLWPYPTEDPESRTKFWLRQATAAWYAAEWICALAGAYALGRRLFQAPWLWGTLLVVSITGVHTFYWTDLRMRTPLMPFLAIVAAVGAERIFTRIRPLLLAQRASLEVAHGQ